jgi:hypothetical protein
VHRPGHSCHYCCRECFMGPLGNAHHPGGLFPFVGDKHHPQSGAMQPGSLFRGLLTIVLTGTASISSAG